MTMRLLVTGARGQLGRALERACAATGHEWSGLDLPELDVTDRGAVLAAVDRARPDVVVNAAAYTAVDAAESDETAALAVNGTAVRWLAEAANRVEATLVQVSTDYVFDGATARPYREDDAVNPLSAYGRTKLAGERAAAAAGRHLIVRTAWLFGQGANFVEAILGQLGLGRDRLEVVADQIGTPTYAADLAAAIVELLERRATGLFHAVNAGQTSWHGFAQEIVRQIGAAAEVVPIPTERAARPAPRPRHSVLDTTRLVALVGHALPPWPDALARYLAARSADSVR